MGNLRSTVASDIHVNDWEPFSETDEFGRPSRLLLYEELAHVIVEHARANKSHAIFVPGDISESAVQRPRVLEVIGNFFRILSTYGKPVYVIPGQHDMDTKEEAIVPHNCILQEICQDIPNIVYAGYPQSHKLSCGKDEFSIWLEPWNRTHQITTTDEHDVFIGHGLVSGCSDHRGYIFENGFTVEQLTNQFKVAIIGDIHNGQIFRTDGRARVLIPGTPIQGTWKDAPNCGLWSVEISATDKPHKFVFSNIHELKPATFHQFVYDQDEYVQSLQDSNDPLARLIHSRATPQRLRLEDHEEEQIEIDRSSDYVMEIASRVLDESKPRHPKGSQHILRTIFEQAPRSEMAGIPDLEITRVYGKDFTSIGELDFNFEGFNDQAVIVGANGSGKSSLGELIYWTITGYTTKGLEVSEIPHWSGDGTVEGRVWIRKGDQMLEIIRGRDGSPYLRMEVDGKNPYARGSIRETQQTIYETLGLQDWQIRLFCYFSAEGAELYGTMGQSSKNELVNEIIGISVVEDMRNYTKEMLDKYKVSINELNGRIRASRETLTSNSSKLEDLTRERDEATSEEDKSAVKDLENKIEELMTQYKEAALKHQKLDKSRTVLTTKQSEASASVESSSKRITSLSGQVRIHNHEIEALSEKIKKAGESNTCYACGSDLHDDSLLQGLKTSLTDERTKREDIVAQLSTAEQNKTKMQAVLDGITAELDKCRKAKSLKDQIEIELSNCKTELAELRMSSSTSNLDGRIQEVEASIAEINTKLPALQENLQKHLKHQECLEDIAGILKRNGQLIKELNKTGAELIQKAMDELTAPHNFSISIDSNLDISGRFRKGKSASYRQMSTGQRRVANAVMSVALNNLVSRIYNIRKGVLGIAFFDEVLSFLDPEYLDSCRMILDHAKSAKVLVVTHDTRLMSMFDNTVRVHLDDNERSVYNMNWESADG